MGNPCASPVEWDDEQLTLPMDKSRCFMPQLGKVKAERLRIEKGGGTQRVPPLIGFMWNRFS